MVGLLRCGESALGSDMGAARPIVNRARAIRVLLCHASRSPSRLLGERKMTKTLVRRCLVGLSLVVLAGSAAGQARLWDKPGPCDRDCLKGIVDKYVDAMVKHDAKAAPFAANVKFTENAEAFPIGQGGLWTNATGASKTYRIYVPDPISRQVGFLGVIQTGDMSNQLALR